MYLRLFAPLLAVIASIVAVAHAAPLTCKFKYTDDIKHRIVQPVVVMHAQGAYPYYDWDKPLITRKGRNIELLIGATKIVGGRSVLDANYLGILIDPCRSKFMEWYWVSPFPVVN